MKTVKNISITMPSAMAKETEKAAQEERRTMSEFFREAVRRYLDELRWRREWTKLREYGTKRAKAMGVKPKDVNRLIQEYRAGQK